jgi:hypothetical protein
MAKAKLIKVTFMKKKDALIGSPWIEYPHWISSDMVNMMFLDTESGHTVFTVGATQFHIKEDMNTVAAMINKET